MKSTLMNNTMRGLGLALSLGLAGSALAESTTGVSDDRVSLPEGPGSLEGVGDNVEADPNMGMMNYRVAITVPQGFPGVTPSLGLSYSSGGGDSIVGIGWSMAMPSIERMTHRRLPRYDTTDDFSVNGGEQLIRLPGTDPAVYRARFEKSFVRYTWVNGAAGNEGYFKGELPDGTVNYYGATSDGTLVPEARASGTAGTFRYHLVETVDVHGHALKYTYTRSGTYPLLTSIKYVFDAQDTAAYEVTLTYEERRDTTGVGYISDGQPGFNLLLTQRLSRVDVKSRGVTIRQYFLTYETYAAAGGFTRLKRVRQQGAEGGTFPVIFDFEYSQALGGVCSTGGNCTRPFMVSMGTLGVNMSNGTANLIDINGDALPDVIDASLDGPHRFFLNVASTDGRSSFQTAPVSSAVGTRSSHNLTASRVQVLDANGDGFTDIVNATNGSILINNGSGDWQGTSSDAAATALADLFAAESATLRFIDYNNDKKIDVMRSTLTETTFYENRGSQGIQAITATALGVGFDSGTLQLTDMNGDGLLDPVRLQAGALRYWRNLGWGRFDTPVDITGLPFIDSDIPNVELEDLNGDGLSDLILVKGTSITYALNNNSSSFNASVQLDADDVDGSIPNREMGITVLYADMNGNGSTDVVWISNNGGAVNYLELFPIRPNLISRITNAIGQVTTITYGTAAVEMARDGGWNAWKYRLPYPMTVLKRLDHTDLLSNLHDVTEYSYHDGFYDGVEKQFRGFEHVEVSTEEEASQEAGLMEQWFDVGATDPYLNGQLLKETSRSGTRDLHERTLSWTQCDVAEVPAGTTFPVKHPCLQETVQILKEGRPEAEWVTTRTVNTYDGYGNVTLLVEHGVTSIGGGACAACTNMPDEYGQPCGMMCLGDEKYTETTYVPSSATGGRWIINAPVTTRNYAVPMAALTSETTRYYDGDAFVGLPAGQLTLGLLTRQSTRVRSDATDTVDVVRNRHDSHGNVVETMDPLGSTMDPLTHRRLYTYDSDHLRVIQADLLTKDADGTAYALRREIRREPLFDKVVEGTTWMRVVGGSVVGTRRSTTYAYDQFGRMVKRFFAGNTTTSADEEYFYDLQSPASRIITRARSQRGGALDIENIQCFDGRGRKLQTRTRLAQNQYLVDGLTLYNLRSMPLEVFQPYQSTSDACEGVAPSGVLSTTYRYDALDRELEVRAPADGVHGSANVSRREYGPLFTTISDPNDTDAQSPHAGTPLVVRRDGLDRILSTERVLTAGGAPGVTTIRYDGLGRPSVMLDPGGNRKTQQYDLLDRVISAEGPNTAGTVTLAYDAANNLVSRTDARGLITRTTYDGLNRPLARWQDGDASTRTTWRYDHDPDCDASKCTNTEGRVARITYPGHDGTEAFEQYGYDNRNREIFFSRTIGGHAFEQSFTYDNTERLLSISYPGNREISFTYDDASRVTGITGLVSNVTYDARGLMTTFDRNDGTRTTAAYDDLMRISSLASTQGSTTLQGFAYTRDRMGNILSITDPTSAGVAGPTSAASYSYDSWYRLSEARIGTGTPEVLTFVHDALDNIQSVTSTNGMMSPANKGSYTYGSAPNAITQLGSLMLDYDADGNLASRGELTLSWDHLGRLAGAQRGGRSATNIYAANQSRVARIQDDSTSLYPLKQFEVHDGISTLYVRLMGQTVARIEDTSLATALLPDTRADDEINAADAYLSLSGGDGADAGPQLWSSVRRLLVESGPDDGVTHLHTNHLRTATLATGRVDGQTTVLGKRGYYPLGELRLESVGFVDDHGFSGQVQDDVTGFLQFDWRHYDPGTGRWVSVDPLYSAVNPAGLMKPGESTSAYGFVGGNLINRVDPTGLDSKSDVSKASKQGKVPNAKAAKQKKSLKARVKGWFKKKPKNEKQQSMDNSSQQSQDMDPIDAELNRMYAEQDAKNAQNDVLDDAASDTSDSLYNSGAQLNLAQQHIMKQRQVNKDFIARQGGVQLQRRDTRSISFSARAPNDGIIVTVTEYADGDDSSESSMSSSEASSIFGDDANAELMRANPNTHPSML